MKMQRLWKFVTLLTLMALLVSACVQKVEPTPEPTEAPTEEATEAATEEATPEEEEEADVLKIGQLSMQSGVMALYGQQQHRGFMLGLEYASGGQKDEEGNWMIAGRPVEVLLRDTEGDPEKGVSLARELIEAEGVELLQGPVSSAVAAALTTVAEENEIILMVDPAASAFTTGQYFNPYVFRTSRTNYDDTWLSPSTWSRMWAASLRTSASITPLARGAARRLRIRSSSTAARLWPTSTRPSTPPTSRPTSSRRWILGPTACS